MKSNHQDIIDELKELQADFLQKDKQRISTEQISQDLSEEFFLSVMNKVTEKETKVVSIQAVRPQKSFTNIFRIAASFIVLLAVSGIIYSVVTPKADIETTDGQNLQQLISQTSSQEIFDYLYENGIPADEEFLYDYVEESGEFNSKNL